MINSKSRTRFGKGLTALALSVALGMQAALVFDQKDVRADGFTKDITNTYLGGGSLGSPMAPKSMDTPWTGSFLWYGKYEGEPVKYRVLDPHTDIYGSETIFLDCDSDLYHQTMDADGVVNEGASAFNEWKYCDLNLDLNGDRFLYKENCFSDAERNAIASSVIKSHDYDTGNGPGQVPASNARAFGGKTTPLNGEKLFLLDLEDVLNSNYGYYCSTGEGENRVKYEFDTGWPMFWWFRSPVQTDYLGKVRYEGDIYVTDYTGSLCISPAMNISLDKVLFSSVVKAGDKNGYGSESKLTIISDTIKFSAPEGAISKDGKIEIPFSTEGGYDRLTVMITDKPYTEAGAKMLSLDELKVSKSSVAELTISSNLALDGLGSKYHVYVFAEDINDIHETDYASKPVEITKITEKTEDTPTKTPTTAPANNPSTPSNPSTTEQGLSFGDFVERLYVVALGRQSEPEGKAFWCEHVGNGDLNGAQCANEFLLSKEFNDRGLSDEEFLKVLYKTFFDRDASADPDGFNFWMNSLKTEGRDKIVDGFINSEEWCNICASYGVKSGATRAKATIASKNATAFAERLYTKCLGRDAEAEGLKFWSLGLTNLELTGSQAAHEFFFSKEFNDHNYDNKELITRMYRTFMGREPEEEGMNFWLDSMKNGMTKEQVFNEFVKSAEFTQICKDYAIDRG